MSTSFVFIFSATTSIQHSFASQATGSPCFVSVSGVDEGALEYTGASDGQTDVVWVPVSRYVYSTSLTILLLRTTTYPGGYRERSATGAPARQGSFRRWLGAGSSNSTAGQYRRHPADEPGRTTRREGANCNFDS